MNFLKWFLIIGGAVILVLYVLMLNTRAKHDNNVNGESIYSPDKQYKAVVFREAGGGGISPYCATVISVVPANFSDAVAYKTENRVYVYSECQGFGSESLNWNSNQELNIGCEQPMQLKTLSSDGKIRIIKTNFTQNDTK
jgi:hypothetical protein